MNNYDYRLPKTISITNRGNRALNISAYKRNYPVLTIQPGKTINVSALTSAEVDYYMGMSETFKYIDTFFANVTEAATIDEIKAAIENPEVTEVVLAADITPTEQIVVGRKMIFDGNGHTITTTATGGTSTGAGLLCTTSGTVIRNVKISGPNPTAEGWDVGAYGLKLWNAKNVVLDNVTVNDANAGILVSETTVTVAGDLNVSNNEFGGIELETGAVLKINDGARVINASESETAPTAWSNDDDAVIGRIEGGNFREVHIAGKGQTYYFVK